MSQRVLKNSFSSTFRNSRVKITTMTTFKQTRKQKAYYSHTTYRKKAVISARLRFTRWTLCHVTLDVRLSHPPPPAWSLSLSTFIFFYSFSVSCLCWSFALRVTGGTEATVERSLERDVNPSRRGKYAHGACWVYPWYVGSYITGYKVSSVRCAAPSRHPTHRVQPWALFGGGFLLRLLLLIFPYSMAKKKKKKNLVSTYISELANVLFSSSSSVFVFETNKWKIPGKT